MHGNIPEFVRDLFADAPLADAADPLGPKEGDLCQGKRPPRHRPGPRTGVVLSTLYALGSLLD